MGNKFEEPKLEIIYFVGELDTLVESGEFGDDNGEWTDPADPDD